MRCVGSVITFTLGLVLLASGCADEPEEADGVGQGQQAIHNAGDGKAGFDDMAHPQIVTLSCSLGPCTGWLAASNVIVTAAHCTPATADPNVPFEPDLNHPCGIAPKNLTEVQKARLLATVPPQPGVSMGQFKAIETLVHPNYKSLSDTAWDVALLVLPDPIPRSVMKPLRVVPGYGSHSFWIGYTPRLLGVGVTQAGCNGFDAGGPVQFLDNGTVTGVTADYYQFANVLGGSRACAGDSGGPFLTRQALNTSHPGKLLTDDAVISILGATLGGGSGDNIGPILEWPGIRDWLVENALDRDGDGMESYYDKCDGVTATTQGEPQDDKDNDGVGDACDACPLDPNNEDTDGDKLLDCVDPCPDSSKNPDSDGDGYADCVDVCPGDGALNADDEWGDADFDGICNSVDSCPLAANGAQRNANLRSELAHNAEVLGDACDPVPVPDAQIASLVEEDPAGLKPCVDPECPGATANDGLFLQCGTIRHNKLRVLPLRSQHKTDPKKWQNVLDVPTEGRFCQVDEVQHITCVNKSYDIRDDRLLDAPCAAGCATPETEKTHFHRISFSLGGSPWPDGPGVLLDYTVGKGTIDPLLLWVWDYSADFNRWIAASQLNPALMLTKPSDLLGALWLHADTNVGANPNVHDKGFYHDEELANRHLTNVYDIFKEDVAEYYPERADCFTCVHLTLDYLPDVVSDAAPGAPKPAPPAPYFVWRPHDQAPEGAFRRRDAEPLEASIVLRASSTSYAAVRTAESGCNGEVLEGHLGPALLTRLGDASLLWVNAAEPMALQGADPSFPLAVALSSGPVDVLDTIVDGGGALKADGDRGLARAPGVHAPPVTRFAAVLSRVRRGVYVVGGEDPVTGALSGRIWFRQLDGSVWKVVPAQGYEPQKVLAATYSFATDTLYVLDEQADQTARLVGIDVLSGAVTTLGAWPRNAGWDLHWLIVDRDGALLLASSNTASQQRVITRIDVTAAGGPQVSGRSAEGKALVMAPVVDAGGYTLVLRKAAQSAAVEPKRLPALPLVPATFADVGSQL